MREENEDEIDVVELTLNEGEIDEVIAHLIELKEHKKTVQFPVASDLDLAVTYTDEENEDFDDDEEDEDEDDEDDIEETNKNESNNKMEDEN